MNLSLLLWLDFYKERVVKIQIRHFIA